MIVRNTQNNQNFPITKEAWDKMGKEQKLKYDIIDSSENMDIVKPETVQNEVARPKPEKIRAPEEKK